MDLQSSVVFAAFTGLLGILLGRGTERYRRKQAMLSELGKVSVQSFVGILGAIRSLEVRAVHLHAINELNGRGSRHWKDAAEALSESRAQVFSELHKGLGLVDDSVADALFDYQAAVLDLASRVADGEPIDLLRERNREARMRLAKYIPKLPRPD